MLPERRKKLIFTIVAIIGVVLVIIIMYNLAKYMRNQGVETPEERDDAYPEVYPYYGVYYDTEGTYKLTGLNGSFEEFDLGLRIFFPINNLFWRNNHLVFYSDATNELRYNSEDEVYTLYELDTFYSNNVDIIIAGDTLIMVEDNVLSYRTINANDTTIINENLISEDVFYKNNKLYYIVAAGIYEYNMENGSSRLVMIKGSSTNQYLVAINDDYLILQNDNTYYSYDLKDYTITNITNEMEYEEFDFVALMGPYFIYQIEDESGFTLRTFSLDINDDVNRNLQLGNEVISLAYGINDNYIYAELSDGEDTRYVIISMRDGRVIKELENRYRILFEVPNEEEN